MNNVLSWFEIPAIDCKRAITFYQSILDITIKETEMFGTMMGFFPSDGTNVSGAIVEGDGYTPSTSGVLAYLNGGRDLQPILDKVAQYNGSILVPKTSIGPEMGYFAIFIDCEGNKMALHSPQ